MKNPPYRVAIGGVFHETNTFASGLTGWQDFQAYQFGQGEDLLRFRSTRSEIGGFITAAEELGWTVIPTLYAAAVPSGLVDHEAFVRIADAICKEIELSKQIDGVLLALHGAMVTTKSEDPEGDLVGRVVDLVGPAVPVVITVDLHANVSDRMVRGVDSLIAYKTYPHVDMYERGREAVETLEQIVRRGERRQIAHRKLPLLTAPQMQYTSAAPMQDIMQYAQSLESDGLQISVTPGFPYADVGCSGFSIIASSWDARSLDNSLDSLGAVVWDRRNDFRFDPVPLPVAIDRARRAVRTPVILVDSADNIGGGAPGDGTEILAGWLAAGLTGLVVTLADPEAVAAVLDAEVGSTLSVSVGGKTDGLHGKPVDVVGYVKTISDGAYEHRGTYNRGYITKMGRTAVLDVAGNTVVVSERKAMPFDAQQLLSLGIDPSYSRALVVKSAIAWRAAFGDVAAEVIEVDTSGVCTGRLSRLPFSEARRRMFPPSEARAQSPERLVSEAR
jgi:microcystin degradation protein MlrC